MVTSSRVPSRIMVMADYTDEALWDWEGFTGPIDSWDLPLPEELRIALRDWVRVYGQLAVTEFIWPDETAYMNWQLQGLNLAAQVQQALGDAVEVDYFEAAPAEQPDEYSHTEVDTPAPTAWQSWSVRAGAPVEPEMPWLDTPITDRTDQQLSELRRRAVEPVVAALLTEHELDALIVYQSATSTETFVSLTARGEQFRQLLLYPGGPTAADVVLIAERLADSLEDFVAESRFAWGQQRIAHYSIPPPCEKAP